MYKSKLQEFCQKKSWDLPVYFPQREGVDHCPRYMASVVVNGASFSTPRFSMSSKDAQNLAAQLALEQLSGPSNASLPINVPGIDDENQKGGADKKKTDLVRGCKSQLLMYVQKRKLDQPVYISDHEGPPHMLRFKCKVTVNGKTYYSEEQFRTVKDAENAAANIALMSLFEDGMEEENLGFFKNLLQEIAQKDYSCLPEYKSTSSGPSHSLLFSATVCMKVEIFQGPQAKTRKLAELYAAKVAYSSLKERELKQISESEGPVVEQSPNPSSKLQSTALAELPQGTISAPPSTFNGASAGDAILTQDTGAYQNGSGSMPVPGQLVGRQSSPMNQTQLELDVESLPSQLKSSDSPLTPIQPPSESGLTENNESSCVSFHGSAPLKKVTLFLKSENFALPPDVNIVHQNEKWVAVAKDESHENAST